MNLNKVLAAAAFLAVSMWSLDAATMKHFRYDLVGNKFGAPELRYELFGTWRVPDEIAIGDGLLGVGVGVNFFFNANWGVGADTHFERLDFPNRLNASVLWRYPMESYGTAPYLFAGGGRQFRDGGYWTTHLGGGLDYRLNQLTGIFIDARRVFVMDGNDFFFFRSGINFRF